MRAVLLPLFTGFMGAALFTAATAQGPSTNQADQIVAAARDALGGGARLASMTSFIASGRTRQVQGDNLVPIEFELACEWPDKCYRRDEIPARDSAPTTIGFSGRDLIQLPAPATPLPDAARAARLQQAKPDFARLTLGLFLGTLPDFPVTFSFAGEAEAPQGKADILDVTGANNFNVRIFVFRETHLPIMLTWQAANKENRIYYADYRDADGLKLPYRLRRAVGADTVEETTFDRFRINAKVDAKKFVVSAGGVRK